MKNKTESKIQQEIVIWYRNNYCLYDKNLIFSVPNESKSFKETLTKKSIGLLTGVSDLIIVNYKKVLFVEVKTPTGKQSDKQKRFQRAVTNLGFNYYIVRSLEEFQTIINIENDNNRIE